MIVCFIIIIIIILNIVIILIFNTMITSSLSLILMKSFYDMKIVNAPRGAVESPKEKFEVFYIDYGNEETVPYSQLRPLDPSVSSAPGLAQLCSLAYIKVPSLEEDFGQEAAEYLSECTLNSSRELRAMVEERDTSGGKVKGQGTGTVLVVTLVDVEAGSSINAAMLQVRTRFSFFSKAFSIMKQSNDEIFKHSQFKSIQVFVAFLKNWNSTIVVNSIPVWPCRGTFLSSNQVCVPFWKRHE